jgi:ADP-heptose:LPS heptosyltransferase
MQYNWRYSSFFRIFNPTAVVCSLNDLDEFKPNMESRVDREIRLIEKLTKKKIQKETPRFNFSFELKPGICNPYIAYAVGGGNFYDDARNRLGPVAQISESLANIENFTLVLLGKGDSDLMRANEIISLNKNLRVLSYVNKASFMETVSIIANSNFFIGYDSSLLKIANILKKNGIALFGPTPPYLILGNDSTITPIITDKAIGCMPCYKSSEGLKNMIFKCKDNVCIKSIAPAKICRILINGLKKIK